MSRLVPFRPHTPPHRPTAVAPDPRQDPHPTYRALLAEWLPDGAPTPGTGIEALMDWLEGRA